MLLIPTSELRPGMRVGKAVVGADGRILLQAQTELRESYIRHLERLGVTSIYVTNELAPDIEPADVVKDQTRQALSDGMRKTMGDMARTVEGMTKSGRRRFTGAFEPGPIKSAVDKVVEDLLANPRAVVNLQDIRSADSYTLGHSVNVCILSTMLGVSAGLTQSQLADLGMGALMHDIGKMCVPNEILNKPDKLTAEEFATMTKHTTIGWEILSAQPEISYTSAAVALQHHERWEGGGYPRSIRKEEIHEYARICCLADCYDAMTADRVYRKGLAPARALKIMTELTRDYFDPEYLKIFLDCVALHPVGSLVQITGGYMAVVVAVERGKASRPRIRVVLDPNGTRLLKPIEVELSERPEIEIIQTVRDEAFEFVPDLIS